MIEENNNNISSDEDDSIDIVKLLGEFWEARRFIIKIILIFTLIGLFIAVFSEKQYTSSTAFVPSVEGKSVSGSLGGLASLVGVNLGSGGGSSEISSELYPKIINSITFQKELLQTQLYFEKQDTLVTYKDYYENIYTPGVLGYLKKYTIGLPSAIISLFKNDKEANKILDHKGTSIISVTTEESKLIKRLVDQINLEVNSKEGFVTISVNMPESIASSQLALKVQELLQKYAMNFKTQKSIDQLNYIKARFLEKQQDFNKIKLKLARFQDENNAINTALGKTKLKDLQSDYDLAFTVYNELAKQLETQQLQVKKDTPLFTVLSPVTIPIERSSPKRFLIVFVSLFLGLILGLGLVLAKKQLAEYKKEWNFKNSEI